MAGMVSEASSPHMVGAWATPRKYKSVLLFKSLWVKRAHGFCSVVYLLSLPEGFNSFCLITFLYIYFSLSHSILSQGKEVVAAISFSAPYHLVLTAPSSPGQTNSMLLLESPSWPSTHISWLFIPTPLDRLRRITLAISRRKDFLWTREWLGYSTNHSWGWVYASMSWFSNW